MKTKFFFDLEMTLIFSWQDAMIMYRNKPIFEEHGAKGISADLFSFAINDEHDVIKFDQVYQQTLEEEFDITIDRIWTVKELMVLAGWTKNMWDFKCHHGKTRSFVNLVEKLSAEQSEPTRYVLFDDMVEDDVLTLSDDVVIQFVKV
jgi:hypothetical protein